MRFWVACVLAVIGSASPVASFQKRFEFDRWYTAMLQSKPIGWMHVQVIRRGDRIETKVEMNVEVRRGGAVVGMETTDSFAETAQGTPIEAQVSQKFASQAITKTWRFFSDRIDVVTTQGGLRKSAEFPRNSQAWLPPAAAKRYVTQQIAKGAKEISYHTLIPSMVNSPIMVTHTLVGEGSVKVLGKVVPAIEWRTVMPVMPNMQTREYVDWQGNLIKGSIALGPFRFVLMEADEQLARARIDPPELLAKTLIESNKVIVSPRQVRSAVFDLFVADGEGNEAMRQALSKLPTIGYQRVLKVDNRSARIRVDLDEPVPTGADKPGDEYRMASTMINSDDPEIEKLASQVLANGAAEVSDLDTAWALCRFVHDFIAERTLLVGFASASEVARTAQGDCSEFAVLLCAMLRARKIPSRVVSGLVYVPKVLGQKNRFGYHMWSQAWIGSDHDGHWIDFDAALNARQFDATHIAISVGALADAWYVNDLIRMVPLLGALSIEVVEWQYTAGAAD